MAPASCWGQPASCQGIPLVVHSPPVSAKGVKFSHRVQYLGSQRSCRIRRYRLYQCPRKIERAFSGSISIWKGLHCTFGSQGGGNGRGLVFLNEIHVSHARRVKWILNPEPYGSSDGSRRIETDDVAFTSPDVREPLDEVNEISTSIHSVPIDDDAASKQDVEVLYIDEAEPGVVDGNYSEEVAQSCHQGAGSGLEDGRNGDESNKPLSLGDGLLNETKISRLTELCARVQASDKFTVTSRDIAALYDFPFDKFQRMAIDGFLKGSSLVVCAPTSSGKTLIAEAAAAATLARGKRLLYTTPLKALSNQKLRDFRELFGETSVGLLTGDAAVNREAPILIMTTEILRNMFYESGGRIDSGGRLMDVDVVVLDEVHYLSDISRGTVWEETVIYCPKKVQLICLSATVANPDELAGWIAQVHGPTELVTSSRRPVPLIWHFSTRHSLLPLLNEEATEMNWKLSLKQRQQERAPDPFWDYFGKDISKKRKGAPLRTKVGFKGSDNRRARSQRKGLGEAEEYMSEEEAQFLRRKQVPKVRDTLVQLKERDMLPAIWFIFSRKGCDTAARYLEVDSEMELLSDKEVDQVQEAIQIFAEQNPEAVREVGVKSLLRGIAAHHAGCLPTWKSFIEELFQRGLVKVVFSTETLAAGINMPARTAVLSSLSKRGDGGHAPVSANAMLQMAGRAGRRGIDDQGHVVVVQTPFEGAEDFCKLLFAGPDPLVSQFTATYGMVLNLLAGARVVRSGEDGDAKVGHRGRTLEEARALIEQSFGNYVGSDVLVTAKQQLAILQQNVEQLQQESTEDGMSNSLENRLTIKEFRDFTSLKEWLKEGKRVLIELREQVETLRVAMVEPLLQGCTDSQFPFLGLCFLDQCSGEERLVPALYVGSVPCPTFISDAIMESEIGAPASEDFNSEERDSNTLAPSGYEECRPSTGVQLYVALGSDNCWYLFTGKSVNRIHQNSLQLQATLSPGEKAVGEILKEKLRVGSQSWQNLGQSGSGPLDSVWCAVSSMDTWDWACQVPELSELPGAHEMSPELAKVEQMLTEQHKEVSKLRKKFRLTHGYHEYKRLVGLQKMRDDKISRLQLKASRIASRINKMQPSGWTEFLQVVEVLHAAGAIHTETHKVLALGEVAAAVRGVNELWLALVFTSSSLLSLMPAQLAAVCGTLVSEGMKARAKDSPSDMYEVSSDVSQWVEGMEGCRTWLLHLQAKHGVVMPAEMGTHFAGLVEAWASGLTWKDLTTDSGIDEGDVARLLRRSIDLLSQIPHLPGVDLRLAKTARLAAQVMDRPPISELLG